MFYPRYASSWLQYILENAIDFKTSSSGKYRLYGSPSCLAFSGLFLLVLASTFSICLLHALELHLISHRMRRASVDVGCEVGAAWNDFRQKLVILSKAKFCCIRIVFQRGANAFWILPGGLPVIAPPVTSDVTVSPLMEYANVLWAICQ